MKRIFLRSSTSNLNQIYKDNDQIELKELKNTLVNNLYQANDYEVKIKGTSNNAELLTGKIGSDEKYKWAIKVNTGTIEEFKKALEHEEIQIIEEDN